MGIAFFRVRNWAKFQHYKDRNPPWIKLHCEIFASEDWVMLDDASKLLAVVCMVVAAKHDGKVPNNPAYIRRVAYLSKTPNLKPLIDCAFLEPLADASTPDETIAGARPEKEAETDTEQKTVLSADADLSKHDPQPVPKKNPYPEPFEAFWRDYPTDPLMSKKKTFVAWGNLDQPSRDAAQNAIPAFKEFCRKQINYRTVHAVRFLSERRFDGFEQAVIDPAVAAEAMDKADRYFKRGKYAEVYQ